MTDQWKLDVRAAMTVRGWKDPDLAEIVGTTKSMIGKILDIDRGQRSSALAEKIAKVLGVPLPLVDVGDDKRRKMLARVEGWSDDEMDRVLALLDIVKPAPAPKKGK